MPGRGLRKGERYLGTDRPFHDLTPESVKRASLETLEKWRAGLDAAYDFDAVDARDFRNMDLVMAELERRYAERRASGPLGLGVLPVGGTMLDQVNHLLDRLEGRR